MTARSCSVLIVDDDALNLDILDELLADQLHVRRATSGEAALAALAQEPADIVLLDIVMPGIDGFETCRRITSDPRLSGATVILVSGRGQKAERIRGYQVGASDYVVKPFDADELLAKIGVFLALRSAQQESRAKSAFLANMSHEIRTPMTAILGYSETLRDATLNEEARQHAIDTIARNGQYLLDLINNILDISKIEAKRMGVDRVECSPAAIIADVVALMRGRAEPARLTVTSRCDGLVPTSIQTDPTRLRQILINLVGNAIKFTEHGGVQIVVRLLPGVAKGPLLEIDVVDSGIGIAKEHVEALCEPFVQADASVTRRFGGTGLGLSISRRLAQLLGGDLTIQSTLGTGSTFTVRIATGALDGIAMQDDLQCVTPRPTVAPLLVALPPIPCCVLLAEDGIDNQRLFTSVLQKAGAEVVLVADGRAAVDRALAAWHAQSPFDVILMDMQMPVLDGYSATAMLREAGYRHPIIAVTAHALAGDRERCLAAGCDEFAAKPMNRAELIRTIHSLLQRRREEPVRPEPIST